MLDFYERRKLKAWVFSKPAILLVLVACFFLAQSVHERYEKERETAARTNERQEVLRELEARAAALEARVRYAESERGVEEEIRDRYDAVKEGERAVVIMDAGRRPEPPPPLPLPEPESPFFSWFFFWR